MQTASRIGAVILAGGQVPPSLTPYCTHRALLQLGGRFLLDYLANTLTLAPSVVGTAIVAPIETHDALSVLPGVIVASGESIVENMQRGARALADLHPTHLLFVTGDIPLVTAAGLEDYLRESVNSQAALTYPIIPKEACERRFPGAKRTYVRLREGMFTGGNVIFTQAQLLNDKESLIQDLYTARKQPFKLAGILGMSTFLRMLSGSLSLPYLESVASRILEAPVRALVTNHAEIGFDVDKIEDLAAVEHALSCAG